jgi:hypothetical protein
VRRERVGPEQVPGRAAAVEHEQREPGGGSATAAIDRPAAEASSTSSVTEAS